MIVIFQVSFQESFPHVGIDNQINKYIMRIITSMLNTPWDGLHECTEEETITNCAFCEISGIFYQLTSQVIEYIVPRDEVKIPSKDLPRVEEIQISKQSAGSNMQKTQGRGLLVLLGNKLKQK